MTVPGRVEVGWSRPGQELDGPTEVEAAELTANVAKIGSPSEEATRSVPASLTSRAGGARSDPLVALSRVLGALERADRDSRRVLGWCCFELVLAEADDEKDTCGLGAAQRRTRERILAILPQGVRRRPWRTMGEGAATEAGTELE